MYPILRIKEGKEAAIGFRHPWMFSGALESKAEHGAIVQVADKHGKVLGTGTYSRSGSIAVRVFAFGDAVINRALFVERMKDAHAKRLVLGYGPGTQTTGYRCVFGEADGLPGLIVDRYEDVMVFQIATAGMDKLREDVVEALKEVFAPRAIIERSDMPSRREENLEPVAGVVFGEDPGEVAFLEHGRRCVAAPMQGQKTGFFLDQKDLRSKISQYAKGKEVLNLFSYTGAAAFAALAGGASNVHNVDGSEDALALLDSQAKAAGVSARCSSQKTDIFQWLAREEVTHDMVIMDPPALIKANKDVEEGKKAYHFLNRAAMKLVKDGGIFVTSSCSHFLPEEDLAFILRRASVQAGVDLQVLEVIRQSPDHPQSVYFPEGTYLKTFICRVRK